MPKRWNVLQKISFDQQTNTTDTIIKLLLENRGITNLKDRKQYLHPDISALSTETVGIDPKQLQKALGRIKRAIAQQEQIIVFGDYDVDGITASAILWETLHELGAVCTPFIPDRKIEGYGLSIKGIENVASTVASIGLIITVDNGIVANEAVAYAKKQGIDVIITDHHTTGETKPDAFAIVHTTSLCGAGIAYLLSFEIRKLCSKLEINPGSEEDTHLELAALGTVADLVPLVGANRSIVKAGLEHLRITKRIGLVALFQQAGISQEKIGVYEIGYMIGPRLNASGRIDSAMESLRLLCTHDARRAMMLASKLEIINKDRQNMVKTSAQHAIGVFENDYEDKKVLVIGNESYEEGIIGLVAGKLVEAFYRPAIVFSLGEKQSKASARSVKGFDIIAFLRQHQAFFVNVGGHPMAAGCTIETTQFTLLKKTLEEHAEALLDEDTLTRLLTIDLVIPFESISDAFYTTIQELGPFGMGNPEPVFATHHVRLKEKRTIGKDGNHVRLVFEQNNVVFEAIGFGMSELVKEIPLNSEIDVAYTIDQNTWNGNTKLQLKVKDVRKVVI